MDFRKIKLFITTIVYLKPIQIYYRVYYFLRNRIICNPKYVINIPSFDLIYWKNTLNTSNSYFKENNEFNFLNIKHVFSNNINWNFKLYGKLWTYNLNYFDFLNQNEINVNDGIILILDYIKKDSLLIQGKEPYPISIRGINWIKFLSENNIKNQEINIILYNHYKILFQNIEFHLLGNHLLENGFSLLFGAYYFQSNKFYKKSKKLLYSELNEQILSDGAHFELSPMYHQIILNRLLDCIFLIQNNSWINDQNLLIFLKNKAEKMLSYLNMITYDNGYVPMVNDSSLNIAPYSIDLFNYGKKLNLNYSLSKLSESGYRKVVKKKYELFIDIGNIGPKYQSGHSHADTFNFELVVNNKPIIVDRGTSTYENNITRNEERGTKSHNTVTVENKNQSDVWGAFRVGKRAKVTHIKFDENICIAKHDGYLKTKGFHKREFNYNENEIIIEDSFTKNNDCICEANFHFHNTVKILEINDNIIEISGGLILKFYSSNNLKINVTNYELAQGFNKTVKAKKISILFHQLLKTKISL